MGLFDSIFSGIKTGIQSVGNFISGGITNIENSIAPTPIQPVSKPTVISSSGPTKLISDSSVLPPLPKTNIISPIPNYVNPLTLDPATQPKISFLPTPLIQSGVHYLNPDTGNMSTNPPLFKVSDADSANVLHNPFTDNPFSHTLTTGKLFANDAWQNIQGLSNSLKTLSQDATIDQAPGESFSDILDLGLNAAQTILTPISFAIKISQTNSVLKMPADFLISHLNALAKGGNGFTGSDQVVSDVFSSLPDFSGKENLRTSVQNVTSFAMQAAIMGKIIGELHAGNTPTDLTIGKFADGAKLQMQSSAIDTINEFSTTKININSSDEEIQKAYTEAARATHPDKIAQQEAAGGEVTASENNFKRVNGANQFLKGNDAELYKPTETTPTEQKTETEPKTPEQKLATDTNIKYQQADQLSTKLIQDLQGREFTSRQYIEQRMISSDLNLKQVEKNIIAEVLKNYPNDKIPVKEFSQKVKDELLPLKTDATSGLAGGKNANSQYQNIVLPKEERGDVKNYGERIYNSPIETNAGKIHFGDKGGLDSSNYFGHTRIEEMGDGKTRRVIEVQSDLYQKGLENKVYGRGINETEENVKKLQKYNDPTAHFRMVREEVKQAAMDGKTKLQFPTGETAMKIEGIGENNHFLSMRDEPLAVSDLKVGEQFQTPPTQGMRYNQNWIITNVLEDGKFQAIPKQTIQSMARREIPGYSENLRHKIPDATLLEYAKKQYPGYVENFDISGKVDTNNPIYKFYEKELAKYLKSKYDAMTVVDKQGVTWTQVDIKPEMARQPVEAFSPRNTGKDITISQATKQLYKLFTPDEVKFLTKDGLIKMPDGGLAFGKSASGLIELVANDGTIKDQTLYHEAFHQYAQQFLSAADRADVLREGIELAKKEGVDGVKTLPQAEEYLADKFADYVKEQGTFTGKIKQFFENLLNSIKKLMGQGQKALDIFNDIISKKRPEGGIPSGQEAKFQQLTPYEEDQYRREVEKEMGTGKEFTQQENKNLAKDILAAGGFKIDPNNPGEYQDIPLHLLNKNGLSADDMREALNQGGRYKFDSPYDVLEAAKDVKGAISNVKPKTVGIQAKLDELNDGYPTTDRQELRITGDTKIPRSPDPKLVAEDKPVQVKVTEVDQNYGLEYAYNLDNPKAGKVFPINALSPEAKADFQNWVNSKRTIPTMGYAAAKPFKVFDKEGIDAFLRFNAGFKDGMKDLETYFDGRYKDATKLGIDMGFKYNYLPQVWSNSAAEILKAYQSFKGTALGLRPAFSMEAVFKDYAEGMKAGLTPKFKNIAQLVNWYEQRFQKAKADIEYYNKLASTGAVQPSNSVDENPAWKMVDPERWPQKQIFYTGSDGIDRLYQGTMSAPAPLAALINNNLRPGTAILRAPAAVMGKLKNIVMSVGVPGTGINPHGVNMLGRAFLLSTNHPSIGVAALKYLFYANSGKAYLDANMDQVIQASKMGLTISNEDHEFNPIGKKVLEPPKNVGGKAVRVVTTVASKIDKTLYSVFGKNTFEKMIPALKIRMWMFEKADLMKKGLDETAAGKEAAITTNQFLSGKNIDQIGRNKDFQNLLRVLVFAPDFAETGFGLGKNIAASGFNYKNPKYNIYRRAGIALIGAYIAMNLWNKKTSGKYMFENASGHQFDVFIGNDANGKDVWFRPFGSSVDFARLPLDIIAAVKNGDLTPLQSIFMNRVSVGAQLIGRPLFNVDPFGNPILGRDKYGGKQTVGKQLSNLGTTELNTVLPGSIDAIIKKGAGLSNAQVASEALGLPFKFNASGVTSQQIQDMRDQATAEIKKGNYTTFNQLIKEGVILPKDRTPFIRNALKPQAIKDMAKEKADNKLKQQKARINAANGRPEAADSLDSFFNLIK